MIRQHSSHVSTSHKNHRRQVEGKDESRKEKTDKRTNKKFKLDILNDKDYNEFDNGFDGQLMIDEIGNENMEENHQKEKDIKKQSLLKQEKDNLKSESARPDENQEYNIRKCSEEIDREIQQNQKVFNIISQEQIRFKKMNASPMKIDKNYQKKDDSFIKKIKQRKSAKGKETQNQQKKQDTQDKQKSQVKIQEGSIKDKNKEQDIKQTYSSLKADKDKRQTSQQKLSFSKADKKQTVTPSSNWKTFLQNSNKGKLEAPLKANTKDKDEKKDDKQVAKSIDQQRLGALIKNLPSSQNSKFVAIDCQFVKCNGEQQTLARISIVGQNGHDQILYDSYIKPTKKITDYLTSITGITYGHIKNAPKWEDQIKKVKKILMGKMVVGHTLHKDLQVCGLTEWKGISKQIDIAEFSGYRQSRKKNSEGSTATGNGKTISLKRLSKKHLDRQIQSGWHSSVEDAVATIDLFLLNKKNILKEFKVI